MNTSPSNPKQDEQQCPQCGGHGKLQPSQVEDQARGGLVMKFHCLDCGHVWEVVKKTV
jgi:uncharacterized Zn finger protein